MKLVKNRTRGQSTIEYILMVAFGAVFSLQVMKFFNDIFRDGLVTLEQTISEETKSGQGYAGNGN